MNIAGDPWGIFASCWEIQKAWISHPSECIDHTAELWRRCLDIPMAALQRHSGKDTDCVVSVSEYDERFQDPIWSQNPISDMIKEYYLLTTRWLEDRIFHAPAVDEKVRRRAAFWVRQGLNILAPTNFFWTNPKAVSRFCETGGQSLLRGMVMLREDIIANKVKMVDSTSFKVGKNIAMTLGQVIFRNELMEVIQYTPMTPEVHQVPIVFIPPWINKYYILDINPEKSLVQFLLRRGYTVFMISWKNPGSDMRHTPFSDYVFKGAYQAVQVAMAVCQAPHVHAIGYCIGGTTLSMLMAWLNAHPKTRKNTPIAHATWLTTLVDFEHPGDIDVFIDEGCITEIERLMKKNGYLEGSNLEQTFRVLRSNSLIWHYAIMRYLYGEETPAFDILHWNTDSTRLPEAMHSFYLRELYLHNKLREQGGITLKGIPIDLREITQSLYVVGAEQDHITPWKEVFKICDLAKGPIRYVLATSGHIVGILNPPVDPPKRRYWVGDATGHKEAMAWRDAQPKKTGSWWADWAEWLEERGGPLQKAPGTLGNKDYPPLEAAPGKYVLE